MMPNIRSFERSIEEAITQPFSGWDFSYLDGRMVSEELPWDYAALAKSRLASAGSLLDMGTGGGEALADLAPLPRIAFASEAYLPNLKTAANRLRPLGVHVVAVDSQEAFLPFRQSSFALVINRHESFTPAALSRILAPGGIFLTQQVGGRDNIQLNEFLQEEVQFEYIDWSCQAAVDSLQQAGFEILRQEEVFPQVVFKDFTAVLFYLRVIEWQIADFSVQRYEKRLLDIYRLMDEEGEFRTRSHRFLIEARKKN